MSKKRGLRSTKKSVAPVSAHDGKAAGEVRGSVPTPGVVDAVSHERIAGWAWNPDAPDESVVVEIFDGNELLMRVRADTFREDLREAGIGTGSYGFSVLNPTALLPLARHQISVRRAADGVDLAGSPQWLLRPEAGFDASLIRFLNSAASAITPLANSAAELNEQVALALRVLNQLLNARNSLAGNRPLFDDPHFHDLLRGAEVSGWTRAVLATLEKEFAPLRFAGAGNPLVSIVISVCNEFRSTYACLRSITEDPSMASFEVILVDDCSWDETLFVEFVISGAVRILRNSEPLGVVRSCNAGAAQARGQYLLFLDRDMRVRPHWLDELVSTFRASPNVGIAGAKLLCDEGTLQAAGGILGRLGEPWDWGQGGDPNDPKFCFFRDVDFVRSDALMVERELFERVGRFDESYGPGCHAAADLCLRVLADGRRVVVQPASQAVRGEKRAAAADMRSDGVKQAQMADQRRFYGRWMQTLSTHRFDGDQPESEAERTATRCAFFIDDVVPTPDRDAGSNAAVQHMLALQDLGYKVMFVPADRMARVDPYTATLEKRGIECFHAPYYGSVEEVFRKARARPDLVYLHRFTNASKYAHFVRHHFPGCFTVYNVADLHFLRQQREVTVEGSLAGAPRVEEAAELAAMREVDSVIVHSTAEEAILRKKDAKLRVHTVPWTVTARPGSTPFDKRAGYAFVGGYGHRPNVDAAKFLAGQIAPRLRRSHPGITGYLVGSNAPPEITALEGGVLQVLGYVPDLGVLLHRLRCTIAPLRYGAGLKGKILESFAHGLPCVMSDVAAEGLNLPSELDWLVVRRPEEFAARLGAVHEDEALNGRLSAAGLQFIRQRFSGDVVRRLLAEATAGRE